MTTLPLSDVRVIDCATILAGPLCCRILGDYGADVIKIEHPSMPDSMRGHGRMKDDVPLWWKEIARNKRTLAADLKSPDGADVFRRLVETADILVEAFRPGTLEKWGLGPDILHEINPRLVIVRMTGFGQTGPYAQRPGFGTLAEAMSGFAHLTGEADAPPTLPAFGLADSICGIAASSAALVALRHRDATGRGQVVDMNILEPIMTAVGPGPMIYQQTGHIEHRHGNRSTNNAPRNTYGTADGSWVAVSSSAQAIAERVMRLVGREDLIEHDWFSTGRGRAEHVDEIDTAVAAWIGARDRATVLAEFEAAGAAVAPVYDARDLAEDAHVRGTGMLVEVPDEQLGPLLMHNVLWRMSETPGQIRFTGRAHGADTDDILAELGYPPASISDLRQKGAVR